MLLSPGMEQKVCKAVAVTLPSSTGLHVKIDYLISVTDTALNSKYHDPFSSWFFTNTWPDEGLSDSLA